eukprot:PhM_4_TR10227/c0_g1_i1/m.37126/K15285/SLC35E3; solute carrier family 35, member E3
MLDVVAIVVANVASVISVVVLNKMLYQPPHNFHYPTLLISFHFACTWLFVMCAYLCGMFTAKKLPWSVYAMLALAQTGSVAFVNLSLVHNTVGTYQVLKFTNIAVICIIEFFSLGKTYPVRVYCALAGVVGGVCFATVTEVHFSGLGLLHGLLGSVSTAIYQIYNKYIQQNYDVRALQLLHYESPFTVLWSFIFACMTESVASVVEVDYKPSTLWLLLLSGISAFGVNATCYLIIGKTSPVTYGVVGHLKTVGILLFGFTVLGQVPTFLNFLGITAAFFSIVWYTFLTLPSGSRPLVLRHFPLLFGYDDAVVPPTAPSSSSLSEHTAATVVVKICDGAQKKVDADVEDDE